MSTVIERQKTTLNHKFNATWIDRLEKTPANCCHRTLSLKISQIELTEKVRNLSSAVILVKLSNSRRQIRTPEISLNCGIDLQFSITYPHFLKRQQNTIEIAIQRKKTLKSRNLFGFKTLAVSEIHMTQVLQCLQKSCTLNLVTIDSELKSQEVEPIFRLHIDRLESIPQPRFRELIVRRHSKSNKLSDEDDDITNSDAENDETEAASHHHVATQHGMRSAFRFNNTSHFTEKFTRIFNRGAKKATEEANSAGEAEAEEKIDATDSDEITDTEILEGPHPLPNLVIPPDHRGHRCSESPGRLSIQLDPYFVQDELPDYLLLTSSDNSSNPQLAQFNPVFTRGDEDVDKFFDELVRQIVRINQPNSSDLSRLYMKLVILGTDQYLSTVLRYFMYRFGDKPLDRTNFLRFLVVPFGPNAFSSFLSSVDDKYRYLFQTNAMELVDTNCINEEAISEYIGSSREVLLFPIGEVAINGGNVKVPFIYEVQIVRDHSDDDLMPPSTSVVAKLSSTAGAVDSAGIAPSTSINAMDETSTGGMELVIEYRTPFSTSEKQEKKTIKDTFKMVQIFRTSVTYVDPPPQCLTMLLSKKEKRRLLKKPLEKRISIEKQSHKQIDTIGSVMIKPKSSDKVKLIVDGKEYSNVRYFNVSSTTSMHIQHFPLLLLEPRNCYS